MSSQQPRDDRTLWRILNEKADGMSEVPSTPERIVSVDALRGFDMFWITGGRWIVLAFVGLFVNPVPDWIRYQFVHPAWTGFSFWDLIMPTFLFIVGTSMPIAFAKRIERGQSRAQLHVKIVRRSLILILLGMIASGNLLDFDSSTFRLGNDTLQAIACGYFVAGIVLLNLPIAGQAITVAVLLIGYWLFMILVPVPGHGAGVIEPHANAAIVVDAWVFGRFNEQAYAGMMSIVGGSATVLIGVLSGHLLRSKMRPVAKIGVLALAGVGCMVGGLIWAEYLGFPIVKRIWTSSYALWAAGWSLLALASFYAIIDVAGFKRWAFPFVVVGMNAITAYMAVHLFSFSDLADTFVGGLARHLGVFGEFLLPVTAFLILWLILWHMYRQKIFLRI